MNQSTAQRPSTYYPVPTADSEASQVEAEATVAVVGASDAINIPVPIRIASLPDTEFPMTTNAPPAAAASHQGSSNCSPHRRCRLQRSERLQSGGESPTPPNSAHSQSSSSSAGGGGSGGQYSSWEVLIRDSFGQIAWPIKFTSWELIDDNNKLREPNVPTR